MPVRLDRRSADFDERFATFLAAKREVSADVERATRAIVDDVAARGDAALIEATKKFDRLEIEAAGLRVTAAEIDAAVAACDAATLDAMLAAFGSAPHAALARYDDHATDAMLSAAWLRVAAGQRDLWHPARLTPDLARTEGWTFGVP